MRLMESNGRTAHRNNIQLGKYGRNRSDVWRYPGVNSFARKSDEGDLLKIHPTVKPLALIEMRSWILPCAATCCWTVFSEAVRR